MISRNELRAVIATVIGTSFLRGYMRSVLSDPRLVLFQWLTEVELTENVNDFILNGEVQGVWLQVICVDCCANIIGALIFPSLSKRFGRRGSMLVGSYTLVFASLFCGYCLLFNSALMLYIGLFIFGFNNGLFCGLAPAYLLEISRKNWRGAITCTFELAHSIGLTVSHVICVLVADQKQKAWPFAISLVIFPWIISVHLLPTCPRSPRMLYSLKMKTSEAIESLQWLRNSDTVSEEVQELHEEYISNRIFFRNFTWKDVFSDKVFRQCLFVAVLVSFSRQLSGVDMLGTTPHFILRVCGYRFDEMPPIMLGLHLTQVALNIVAMLLVEGSLGRRNLLLISVAGCGLSFAFFMTERLTYQAVGIVALVPQFTLFASYALGLGPVGQFVPFELFPVFASLRAVSVVLAFTEFLRMPFFMAFFWMYGHVNGWVSFNFIIFNLVFFILLKNNLPETRNRSFFDIIKTL